MDYGKKAGEIYSRFGLSDEMFFQKGRGIPGFIRSLGSGTVKEPNSFAREICSHPPKWSTKAMCPELVAAIGNGLDQILCEAIHYYDDNIVVYKSAGAVLSNIYALGILSDVLHNVHLITTTENTFLLSDAGELLNLITMEDQSPFIYEKVGNRFENFMIDEFQDTSIIQWNNFRPLIENSMAEGNDNLVVGDVKQSIYRWRNSDWKILGRDLVNSVDDQRIFAKPLATNWRSRSNIISFNNRLFSIIPDQIDKSFTGASDLSFKKLYSEAVQKDPGKNGGGYVRLEFIRNEEDYKSNEAVLDRLPGIIESLQDKGYKASDIGIIVRDGREGCQVMNAIIDHSTALESANDKRYNFNAVSNDSLSLSNSPVIIFIMAVISVANDPRDYINRATMLRFFLLSTGKDNAEKVFLLRDNLIESSKEYFPDGYEILLGRINEMPLFEATEYIIRFFGLGNYAANIPFLNTFQDYVVSFTGNKNSGIQSFLDWWEETGRKKSVVLPGKPGCDKNPDHS